jgi:hypothetical protein
MTTPLDALDPAFRRTVEEYMALCADRSAVGIGELFTEDGGFQGAFSGGVLRGRKVIEAHLRQSFRGVFSKGVLRYRGLEVIGRMVVIDWELIQPSSKEVEPLLGRTVLELDNQGLIQEAKATWDPKPLMGWEIPK